MGKVASDFSFCDKIRNVLRQSSVRLPFNNNLKKLFSDLSLSAFFCSGGKLRFAIKSPLTTPNSIFYGKLEKVDQYEKTKISQTFLAASIFIAMGSISDVSLNKFN